MTGASRHRGVTRGPVRSATGVGPLLTGLIVTAVILTFLLSDQLLTQLGVPYVLRGGGTLAKIHPSTYLAVAAVLLALLLCGDPVRLIADWTRLRPIYVGYIIVVVIITVYLLGLQGTSGLAFIADTLLRPALLALLLLLLEFRDRDRLFSVLIGILALNSAIGILEVATGWRLVPYTLQGLPVIEQHFRATALMGHPLDNALNSAIAMILVCGHVQRPLLRGALILLFTIGLLSFGGRTAFFAGLGGVVAVATLTVCHDLAKGRLAPMRAILLLSALLIGPLVVAGAVAGSDIGQRIVEKLVWEGSAQARIEAFRFTSFLSKDELWFGIDSARFELLLERLDTVQVVENFWIILVARFGLIAFIPFSVALLVFLYRVAREGGLAAKVAVLAFLLIASSNNSLATKKPALCILVVLTMTAVTHTSRRQVAERHRPARHANPGRPGGTGVATPSDGRVG